MTDRELMQMALDALTETVRLAGEYGTYLIRNDKDAGHAYTTIEALRARLAQPEPEELGEVIPADEEQLKRIAKLIEPEPVAWMYNGNLHEFDPSDWAEGEIIPLYTAPPQREWQGLTTQEIADETDIATSSNKDIFDLRKAFWCGARWAEDKLKEKNA